MIGWLYSLPSHLLSACLITTCRLQVEDEDALRRALAKAVPHYAKLWDEAPVDAVRN